MPYKNKEVRAAYKKEYCENHKEEKALSDKKYHENHKEKINARAREYREKNKEKIAAHKKEYCEKNKDKISAYCKEYSKTEACKKSNRISGWKVSGLIHNDYDALYEHYINTKNCDYCNVELIEGCGKTARCMDHSHKTNLFRNVLCNSCNTKRREDNF